MAKDELNLIRMWCQAAFEAGRRVGIYGERDSVGDLPDFPEWWADVEKEVAG